MPHTSLIDTCDPGCINTQFWILKEYLAGILYVMGGIESQNVCRAPFSTLQINIKGRFVFENHTSKQVQVKAAL
jgi:hypothetical protein